MDPIDDLLKKWRDEATSLREQITGATLERLPKLRFALVTKADFLDGRIDKLALARAEQKRRGA